MIESMNYCGPVQIEKPVRKAHDLRLFENMLLTSQSDGSAGKKRLTPDLVTWISSLEPTW